MMAIASQTADYCRCQPHGGARRCRVRPYARVRIRPCATPITPLRQPRSPILASAARRLARQPTADRLPNSILVPKAEQHWHHRSLTPPRDLVHHREYVSARLNHQIRLQPAAPAIHCRLIGTALKPKMRRQVWFHAFGTAPTGRRKISTNCSSC